MNQEEIHARHLVELGFLEDVFTNLGYTVQLIERSEQIPYHVLLVALTPDDKGRPQQLTLTFYPVGEDDVQNTLLLQYFIEAPFTVDADGLSRLRELMPAINNKIVLGHLGITEGQNKLHYRYVQALPVTTSVSEEAVSDVIMLFSYTPLLFNEILEKLAAGEITVEQARAEINAKYAGE